MRNKITDLNNHLFAQLERLNDETLKGENLTEEIDRSRALSSVAKQLVNSYKIQLNAIKLMETQGYTIKEAGDNLLGIDKND